MSAANVEITTCEEDGLTHFTVCLRHPGESVETFPCWAEDSEHAEEQARNAWPDSDLMGAIKTLEIHSPYVWRLEHGADELATAALDCVMNWEKGDLAGAVNVLDDLLDELPWFDREIRERAISEN